MKTKKSLLKRIKISKNNKWIRRRANTSHLAASKSRKQRTRLIHTKATKNVDKNRLKKMLNI